MPRSSPCPKCAAPMDEGYILDRAHGEYGSRTVSLWVEGPPEKAIWMGLKIADRRSFSVATFRCQRCVFLESYAG